MSTDNPVLTRTTCRLCGSSHIRLAVPLVSIPVISPNVGLKGLEAVTAPLDTYLCEDCGLVQLIHVVDPSLIYRDYLYRTTISRGLTEHFATLAQAVIDRTELTAKDLVVEFGSNDGTLLNFFREAGMAVQGVDPAVAIAGEATARGIPTVADFFGVTLARQIRAEKGAARAVLSNNCIANIDDLTDILAGVECLLAEDGVFVFETQNALAMFENFLLDVIYHEHISYFSVQPVARALPSHGLELFDAELIPTKGGSLRFWVQKKGGPRPISPRVAERMAEEQAKGLYDLGWLGQFGQRVQGLRDGVKALISDARAKGGKVAAFGTSVGCMALIHQMELQHELDFLLDDTPFKATLDGPDYSLPVHKGSELEQLNPSVVLVLAWRYAEMIAAKHPDYVAKGGRFAVVLPELRVL